MKPDNVRDLYNHIASKYNQNRSKASNDVTELPKILKLAGDVKGKKLLDLGCGMGRHAKEYLDMGAKVTGVDVSEEMIKLAKKIFPRLIFLLPILNKSISMKIPLIL